MVVTSFLFRCRNIYMSAVYGRIMQPTIATIINAARKGPVTAVGRNPRSMFILGKAPQWAAEGLKLTIIRTEDSKDRGLVTKTQEFVYGIDDLTAILQQAFEIPGITFFYEGKILARI